MGFWCSIPNQCTCDIQILHFRSNSSSSVLCLSVKKILRLLIGRKLWMLASHWLRWASTLLKLLHTSWEPKGHGRRSQEAQRVSSLKSGHRGPLDVFIVEIKVKTFISFSLPWIGKKRWSSDGLLVLPSSLLILLCECVVLRQKCKRWFEQNRCKFSTKNRVYYVHF